MGWEIHAAHQRQILAAWVEGDPRGAKSEIAAAACERRKLRQRGARTERAAAACGGREMQGRAEGAAAWHMDGGIAAASSGRCRRRGSRSEVARNGARQEVWAARRKSYGEFFRCRVWVQCVPRNSIYFLGKLLRKQDI